MKHSSKLVVLDPTSVCVKKADVALGYGVFDLTFDANSSGLLNWEGMQKKDMKLETSYRC